MGNKHDLSKDYYELYAKLLLETALPDEFANLLHQDRPDLVCPKNDIGIEVTRAMFSNDGDAQGLLERFQGKPFSEIKESTINLLEKKGYEFFIVNGCVAGYAQLEGVWVSPVQLQQAYIQKIQKLKKYPLHKENDLFIFGPSFRYYQSDHIIEFCRWLGKTNNKYDVSYDMVFVFDEPVLYRCTPSTQSVRKYRFPEDTLTQLCQKAFELSK